MNIGRACAIFKDIDNNKYTNNEKFTAIYEVVKMETHNSITKAEILKALAWLVNDLLKVKEG